VRDRAATRSLVLGLLALPFGVFAPFAVWSALGSLRRIAASDGRLRGGGSAMAGLVAGALGLLVILIGIVFWAFAG
jgi:hypothetical protein